MINKGIVEEFVGLKKREEEIIKSLSLSDTIDLYFELTDRGIMV